ncbi:hypothetical protein [Natrarchaeobius oligotrophus]|uniref:DUF2178 domain-containing protein n=1 Tax=Natrarchaeobius chitinivorans TaxID=1679083 RepID=A0A3N6M8M3_NATCH|nr:hypothetical protein [Natrarchaeobius chitinivorans]RQG98707.1 hypothetical protein EA472_17110 [Natrarchaeobius chitinivorans]
MGETLRIISIVSCAVALLGFLGGVALGRILAGAFIFLAGMWIGVGLALYEWRSTKGTDKHESNEAAFRRASYWSVVTVNVAAGTLFPPVFFLSAKGWIKDVPGFRYVVGTVSVFLLFFTALYVVFWAEM